MANLLDNAMKYTPKGGAMTLRVRTNSHDQAEISVTDTGPGIPEADRERAVKRFVRLEASRTQPGNGLGLAMVDAIARLHHGQFELSDGPGKLPATGLRAALLLPKAQE